MNEIRNFLGIRLWYSSTCYKCYLTASYTSFYTKDLSTKKMPPPIISSIAFMLRPFQSIQVSWPLSFISL